MRTKLVPVPPAVQVPLLMLYSQLALASMLLTLIVPLLVMLSVAEIPASVCSASPGAAGGVVSMVMGLVFCLGVVLILPARSVCLILIVPTP